MTFHIENDTLQSCTDMEEIVRIPAGVQRISCWAFRNNKTLREVYIPEGVIEVEDSTFKECFNLRKAVLPDSLCKIGEAIFSYCRNLEELTLGNHVEEIAYGAFFACSSLKTIQLPPSLQHIGNGAFNGCARIQELTLPNGLRDIGNYAFSNTGITELVLPDGLERCGPGILQGCKVRHLTVLGVDTKLETICNEGDLQGDAMLTADAWKFEDYPKPFQPIHGLRSFAVRHAAGEEMPAAVEEAFRRYLTRHFLRHLDEPAIFQLVLNWKAIPMERMEGALRKAAERENPGVVAALLQYQHEVFSQGQVDEVWQRRISKDEERL